MKTIELTADEIKTMNHYLGMGEIDFDKVDIGEDATLLSKTVVFDDGTWAELKVCSGQHNCWAEVVWFDKDGYEICCTEPQFTVDGDWECYALDEDGGDAHTVRVKEAKEETNQP